jgi:hypothetical protein
MWRPGDREIQEQNMELKHRWQGGEAEEAGRVGVTWALETMSRGRSAASTPAWEGTGEAAAWLLCQGELAAKAAF